MLIASMHLRRDGEQHNLTWNCGEEGPTTSPAVASLRARQVRDIYAQPALYKVCYIKSKVSCRRPASLRTRQVRVCRRLLLRNVSAVALFSGTGRRWLSERVAVCEPHAAHVHSGGAAAVVSD